MPPVGCGECHQIDGITGAQMFRAGEAREFRIEPDVGAAKPIEELEIRQHRCVREDVFDEERFAPSAMADDDVGPYAFLTEFLAFLGASEAVANAGIDLVGQGMHPGRVGAVRLVGKRGHAPHPVRVWLGDEIDLIVRPIRKMACEMAVLSGKILVDEKIDHS